MTQKYTIQRVVIVHVYSWSCPINSFTDVFTWVCMGLSGNVNCMGLSGHWEKLEAKLSSRMVSSYHQLKVKRKKDEDYV